MKQFCCGDVVPGCTARFQCATEDQILQAVAVHARSAHGLYDIPAALVQQVRAHIVQL